MADFTMGNGTFYRNGVNFGECDVLTTHSQEFDVLTSHSLTSHFIGETSVHVLHTDSHMEVNILAPPFSDIERGSGGGFRSVNAPITNPRPEGAPTGPPQHLKCHLCDRLLT